MSGGYLRLDPVDGPECPRCGCRDSEVIQEPRSRAETLRDGWFAAQRGPRRSSTVPAAGPDGDEGAGFWPGKARCGFCGAVFSFRPERPAEAQPEIFEDPPVRTQAAAEPPASVPYYLVTCPACGSTDTRVTSTQRPVRRHKCRQCGHTFKSVERKG